MNAEEKNKEVDSERGILTLEVGREVIDKVRTGEITHLIAQIDENNQNMILENIDGNLVLVIDEQPKTFHGCYLYNNGEFPYAIKDELDCILLKSVEEECFTRIISIDIEPGTRFNYQGDGKPIEEDPNGDSCIWEVYFEVVPVPAEAKTYLMRWNPSISSFKEKDFEECVANMVHGMFRMNWSIHEWEEARRGDMFFMMRVGDDKAGIVFLGQFITDPYPADDWAGSTKRRMYVDMVCMNPVEPGAKPRVSLEKLQNAIPEFEWSKGHSGALLSDEVFTKLEELLEEE
jgi:hypothetical protein